VIYLLGLGAGIGNGDEAIYAEMIREMQRSGDYLTLRYQGVELLQRPPTSVALYAVVSNLVPGEAGMRLLPTLLSAGTYGLIATWLLRRTGRLDAAITALVLGAAIPSVYLYGRLAFSDPPFVFACTVALLATVDAQRDPRWLSWAAAALGAAFAVKSLAAGVAAVALVPWLGIAVWRHRGQEGLRRRLIIAVAWFAALALPYYIAGFIAHGGDFWEQHIERILLSRASGELEHVIGIGGPGAYLRHLWKADTIPMALILLGSSAGVAVLGWRRKLPALGVVATYAFGVLAVLSVAGTRLPHYLLLFYPGAVLATGLLVAEAGDRFGDRSALVALLGPALAVALLGTTISGDPFDAAVTPDPVARELGARAKEALPGDAALYTLDWYAPVLGYYADRRWHMLVSPPRLARALASIDPFRYTGTIHHLASWKPPRGDFYVAGDRRLIQGPSSGMTIVDTLATVEPFVLVRVRATAPERSAAPDPGSPSVPSSP
jgi:4-amino-4-deoxy-L-arabinose transferase-like glycosyltransferase